jgi:hypothetical protein
MFGISPYLAAIQGDAISRRWINTPFPAPKTFVFPWSHHKFMITHHQVPPKLDPLTAANHHRLPFTKAC